MLVDTYKIMVLIPLYPEQINETHRPRSRNVHHHPRFQRRRTHHRRRFLSLGGQILGQTRNQVPNHPYPRTYTKNVKQRLDVAKRLFLKFDKDQNGYLSEEEIPELLKETYKQMGIDFTPKPEDISSWMEMADSDKDGKVTLEDYEKLILNSLEKCGIRIYERD